MFILQWTETSTHFCSLIVWLLNSSGWLFPPSLVKRLILISSLLMWTYSRLQPYGCIRSLRNEMCFQGVKWLGVKEILRRIGSTIRSWKILCICPVVRIVYQWTYLLKISRQQEHCRLQDGNKILNALRWVRSGFFVRASILPRARPVTLFSLRETAT
jgi:hypothetical protein